MDIESDRIDIPSADIALAFNVFSYLRDPSTLLGHLGARRDHGILAVRQYDGAALRFGPMDTDSRVTIEAALRASVLSRFEYRHYDMDQVFSALWASPFSARDLKFELFERTAPFPSEFMDYFNSTLDWTASLLSEDAASALEHWRASLEIDAVGAYFFEVDLVAVLS